MKKLDSNNMFDGELFFFEHENNKLYTYCNQHYDRLLVDSETRVILFDIVADCTQNTGYLKVKKD